MFLLKLFCLLFSFFGGIVVNHWLARKIFAATNAINEREILLHGLLISIIVNGTIGTYLSILKIFNIYSFAIVFVALMCVLHRDFFATTEAIFSSLRLFGRHVYKLNPIPIIAACLFVLLVISLAALCLIPTENNDAWVFHLPIALSISSNNGFIYPMIGHPFYANQPSFINLLFAELMLLNAHFSTAALANVAIYSFMFVAMAAAWKNIGFALCALLAMVAFNFSFASGVPTPLTDMPRSCLSVLGLTYLGLYFNRKIPYYAGLAAVCIGAAVAAKYTELITLAVMGVVLMGEFRSEEGRRLIFKCSVIVVVIASYWYVKNLFLFNNPIYPFLFAHPGLTDAWMADYMAEMTRAFDLAHRHFDHNLLTKQGWSDFFLVMWNWFFKESDATKLCLMLALMGVFVAPRLIAPLLSCVVFLFIFWYVVMFNHIRWATPAKMLLFVTACYTLIALFEKISKEKNNTDKQIFGWPVQKIRLLTMGSAILLLGLFLVIYSPSAIIAKITNNPKIKVIAEPILAAFQPEGVELYLSKTREGYFIYRYVTKNKLEKVFQPFDSGVKNYAAIYNGGIDEGWFVDIYDVLPERYDPQTFIRQKGIKYFIVRPPLTELAAERLGHEKLKFAFTIIGDLKLNAELILEDSNGWKLYRVASK